MGKKYKKLIINYQQLQGSQEQLTHLQFGLSHLFSGILFPLDFTYI